MGPLKMQVVSLCLVTWCAKLWFKIALWDKIRTSKDNFDNAISTDYKIKTVARIKTIKVTSEVH